MPSTCCIPLGLKAVGKEVNEGEHFAPLRQIYHSLILALWFKGNFKNSIINEIYADQKKTTGIDLQDQNWKEKIYAQYMREFRGIFREGYTGNSAA